MRAASSSNVPSASLGQDQRDTNTAQRLDRIESILGIRREASSLHQDGEDDPNEATIARDHPSFGPLHAAVLRLQQHARSGDAYRAWTPELIQQLWQSFHEAMPGLHFLPEKQAFTSPTPLLLAAMLYCSSSRGSTEVAQFAPVYYTALCMEISSLTLPASCMDNTSSVHDEEWAFQTVLGVVLAALLSEAGSHITGVWISIAYRILLEHCTLQLGQASHKWRQLFSGLQILDLEHASIHLTCPTIPLNSPLRSCQPSSSDQLYRLSRMMHVALAHFAGRGLTTIWSCFSDTDPVAQQSEDSLSGIDAAVIRDWARQLDDWLLHFSTGPFESKTQRTLVYRQYVMHRLCVYSIYLSSRHFDILLPTASIQEIQELLLSARTAIKIHANDNSIWS